MSERKDKTTTSHKGGSRAKRNHLRLVDARVVDEVFDDGETMPWSESAAESDEGLSAGSQGAEGPGDVDLESARLEYGLTMKQAVFCAAMLRGVPFQADAYREAYDCENMSAASIHKEATKLMRNPKVARCLDAGFLVKERDELHSRVSRRDFVLERLTHEAEHATSDSARVAALVALGKAEAMFTEKVQHDEPDTRTAAEVKADLERKLREVFAHAE